MNRISIPTWIAICTLLLLLIGCKKDRNEIGTLILSQVLVGETEVTLSPNEVTSAIPLDRPITLIFSDAIEQATASAISLAHEGGKTDVEISFLAQGKQVLVRPSGLLLPNTIYTLNLSDQLRASDGSQFLGQQIEFKTIQSDLEILEITYDGESGTNSNFLANIPLNMDVKMHLSIPISESSLAEALRIEGPSAQSIRAELSSDGKIISLSSDNPLPYFTRYTLHLSEALRGVNGERFGGYTRVFYTAVDSDPKFPLLSDDQLLTLVQQQTFKYFWDFAHPASGMARERNTSGNTVTSGGSGFGIMALIVGIERNFISRSQGVERMALILEFLEKSQKFHGAWSHWLDGNTGAALPFSANDNGGDIVETSLLVQGLLTFRQYLNPNSASEKELIDRINVLWSAVEWDWYRRGDQNVLYWHWSPDRGWAMNLQVSGWNESLITYVLAASSANHSIPAEVYHNGWARNGNMRNGETYEGITLPLGPAYGGSLFFSQYSFLGIDPRNLRDRYANYMEQNRNHSLIHHRYSIRNPNGFIGYGANAWGLTASDNHEGYSAHSPTNDLGVITPTAALSAFPYTPAESMDALKFYYYTIGDRLWGEYGFHDAFNFTEQWVADSYIAIDQGPIILMIENYRTGLLWDLFMSAPEIKGGLTKLGFTY